MSKLFTAAIFACRASNDARGAAALWLPRAAFAANGEPTPIPWIDPNGKHNDPPGPGAELSEIYNFNGRFARGRLSGMGKDSQGNTVPFGSPGADFGFMQGEYIGLDGARYTGAYAHI